MKTAFALFAIVLIVQSGSVSSVSKFSDLRRGVIGCAPGNAYLPGDFEEININNNRETAGKFINGAFTIDLEAKKGIWYPESKESSGIEVYAFAEKNKPLQLPGPMIRIPAGTEVHASITNNISEHVLTVYGLYSRPGKISDSIVIAPGATTNVSFNAGEPGTYFYRAVAGDSIFQGLPWHDDSQLTGAFIVDPPGNAADTSERVFVIGIWNDIGNGKYQGGEELVVNGLSWPYTEPLNYKQDQLVKWRVINASNQVHPMHLHGFFYTVNSKGNLEADTIYSPAKRRLAVTELLWPGETMSMNWVPERAGNWLFHCHTLVHIMPGSFLRTISDMKMQQTKSLSGHVHDGMGGLIMGIHVSPNEKRPLTAVTENWGKERHLSLVIGEKPNYFDTLQGIGFRLEENGKVTENNYKIPGPPIILTKDEPVALNVVNMLKVATTMHWHGLEIESYFDGVAGWGNKGNQLAPVIEPGDSFTVHMNPPRAGTYIYHTHMHNLQLLQGMSGPIIVLNKGEIFHPETDKLFFISQADENFERRLFLLNGSDKPDTIYCKKGRDYRFRIVNITALGPVLLLSVINNGKPAMWKMIAKDGADLPLKQQTIHPAFNQLISIGETMDFNFRPDQKGVYSFDVRRLNGKLYLKRFIIVE